jgi:ClpX C4-type zinc finger
MRIRRLGTDDSLRCSFCHKPQDLVGKLISSPSEYPRAYICDECIAVCNAIIEDDRVETESDHPVGHATAEPHPLLNHPLVSDFLASAESWIRQESLGADAAEELAEMRDLAVRMLEQPAK